MPRRHDPFPQLVRPMLATRAKPPFHLPGWVYEEKYDGYRMIAYKEQNEVRLVSRNLHDMTDRFPLIAEEIRGLPSPTLVLDGEVAVFDEDLVSHLSYIRPPILKKVLTPPIFVAFDCLYARGRSLLDEPLRRRRKALEREVKPGRYVMIARRLQANGLKAWVQVVRHGWEGMVAKEDSSPYVPGAQTDRWVKVKHRVRVGWPEDGVEYRRP